MRFFLALAILSANVAEAGLCSLVWHTARSWGSLGFAAVPPFLRGHKTYGMQYFRGLKEIVRGQYYPLWEGYTPKGRQVDLYASPRFLRLEIELSAGSTTYSETLLKDLKTKYGDALIITATRTKGLSGDDRFVFELSVRDEDVKAFEKSAGELYDAVVQ